MDFNPVSASEVLAAIALVGFAMCILGIAASVGLVWLISFFEGT